MENRIRLNRYLSMAGICSRREADKNIASGFVKVNNEVVTEMGLKVNPELDKIEFMRDEAIINEEKLYIALNKPKGVITSCKKKDPNETTVLDLVDIKERVYPIGRLDKDSEGLIILTNDGVLANYLMHPRKECEKEYLVIVHKELTPELVEKLEGGMKLFGEKTKPTTVTVKSERSFLIVLKEGKNRQIRRLCRKVGLAVLKLKRVRINDFYLRDLTPGKWHFLNEYELKLLRG